jgi:ParB family chromosome partitioning protein
MIIDNVSIDSVRPDPNQPRKIFDEAHIKGLAESLRIEGMINPIEVDKDMMIITGECRWRAARYAGWSKVSVNINKTPLPDYERFRRQMAENLHQSAAGGASPMNAIDVAKGYARLIKLRTGKDYEPGSQSRIEIYGLIKDIPQELGVSSHTIWEYLKLLDEPAYVLEDISKGVPRTFYREIANVPEKFREPLKRAISEGKITNREDLRRFSNLARLKPEKAEIEFLRLVQKQNADANRILNRAVELGLALRNVDPTQFPEQDKRMLLQQLGSVSGSIRSFIGKLKK